MPVFKPRELAAAIRPSPYTVPQGASDRILPSEARSGVQSSALNLRDVALDSWMIHAGRSALAPAFDEQPDYYAVDDPILKNEKWALPHIGDSLSPDETAYRLANLKQDRRLKEDLEARGASWSYLMAEFIDPLNYIPIVGVMGVGAMKGAMAGAKAVGATAVGQEALRLGNDPLYTTQEAAFGIATATLFGGAMGGALGRWATRPVLAGSASDIERRARLDDVREGMNEAGAIYDLGHQRAADGQGVPQRHADVMTAQRPLDDVTPRERVIYETRQEVDGPTGPVERVKLTNSIDDAIVASRGERPAALKEVGAEQAAEPDVVRVLEKPDGRMEVLAKTADEVEPVKFTADEMADDLDNVLDSLNVSKNSPQLLAIIAEAADATGDLRIMQDMMVKLRRQLEEMDAPDAEDALGMMKKYGDPAEEALEGTVHYMKRIKDEDLEGVLGLRKGSEIHESLIASAEKRALRLREGAKEARDTLAQRMSERAKGADHDASEFPQLEQLAQRLDEDATNLESQIVKERLAASDALAVDGDVNLSRIKPTGTGLEKMHWSQLPYFLLKNNRLGAMSGNLAHEVRMLADEIASTPGLRMEGGVQGVGTRPSVEASVWQWHAMYERGKVTMETAYIKYLGEEEPGNVSRQVFGKRAKQELIDRPMGPALNKARQKLGMAERPSERKMTYREFREAIGRGMANSDNVAEDVAEDAKGFVQEAMQEWRQVLVDMGEEMESLGVLRSRNSVQKQMASYEEQIGSFTALQEKGVFEQALAESVLKKNVDAVEQMRGQLAQRWRRQGKEQVPTDQDVTRYAAAMHNRLDGEMKGLAGRQAYVEARNAELAQWMEESAGRQFNHFPRTWRPDLIEDNAEVVKGRLREHFLKKPAVTRIHKVESQSGGVQGDVVVDTIPTQMTEEALTERVDLAYAHLMREVSLGDEAVSFAGIIDGMEDKLAAAEVQLAAVQRKHPGDSVLDVAGARNERVWDEQGEEVLGRILQNKDGTSSIVVNEQLVRKQWADESTNMRERLGVETVEEAIEFVKQHEAAHARLWKRGAMETTEEYELRVDLEAGRALRGEGLQTEEVQAAMAKRDGIKQRLGELKAQGHTSPRGLMGRRALDVDTRDWLDFIETDVELVMSRYIQKVGPRMEMARRFGDVMMEGRLGQLSNKLDDAILEEEIATGKPARAMRAERDQVLQGVRDLRDKVLGVYGFPEDPSAWHVRAVEFARSYNVLSVMGKAWMAALADTGAIVMSEGLGRTFRHLGRSWAGFGRETGGAALARKEVQLAGLASEMTFATRLHSMTDLSGQYWGKSKIEQWVHASAGKMFILNGLAAWTDGAKKFAGSMISSRLIETSVKSAAGKASAKELEALSRAGITQQAARLLAAEWKNAGAQVVDGMHIANSAAWRNPDAARLFRSAMAQETNIAVITPGVADKLNFMSQPMGALIFQYKQFAMASTWRIGANAMQMKDKQALVGVMSLVALGMMVDKMKRPDWSEPSFTEALYRGIELSGVSGIFADINASVEALSGNQLGVGAIIGTEQDWRPDNWATRVGVAGPAASQTASILYAMFDESATGNDKARAIRYGVPFNNVWLWDEAFRRMQREGGEMLGGNQ